MLILSLVLVCCWGVLTFYFEGYDFVVCFGLDSVFAMLGFLCCLCLICVGRFASCFPVGCFRMLYCWRFVCELCVLGDLLVASLFTCLCLYFDFILFVF